jgi:uncharacterized protein YuzE
MPRIGPFNVAYDHDSDVLYVSIRREAAMRGVEDKFGTVWRYDKDGELLGVTIVDFREVWADRGVALAEEISQGFKVPVGSAMAVIVQTLEQAAIQAH